MNDAARSAEAAGWLVLRSEYVIETPFLRLRRDEIEVPGGRRIDGYYVRESRGFAVIFAVTPDERVVLVRQYKHGIGARMLELPAGGIEPDESALACAERELAEETGYAGDRAQFVAELVADPTNANFRFSVFLVRDATLRFEQHLDETEAIDVELATFAELRNLVRDGSIVVGSQLASIYATLDHLGRL